ncbi:MAG: cyclic pyranopterin monophosphate synthase [Actinomycetota bacterium]|jgi:cyclic pyranopterin phosphate synthase|nr:MAG: cyclic pyranopterin monophosphate synthase [Actinomycetota bacterium]
MDTAPADGPLVDAFGRVARDLRISVTDRCNFRCTYCMPAEGLTWLPKEELLTFEELARLLAIFVRLGIRSVKITGGEPTVRADLPTLVRMFRAVGPDLDLSLTTNGVLLDRLAAPLAEAGLDRVTVSCDSLLRHRFAAMTRRDALDRVLAGLRAAEAAGLRPVKINCVVIGGTNDDELLDFARWSRETGYEVRFIEYMPLDAERRWRPERIVPSARILEAIGAAYPLVAVSGSSEPATTYAFADGAPGRIGVIASVTEPFCDRCDRLRLTAEGCLRTCLFALEETDLRGPLRAGASDEELVAILRDATRAKWAGHRIGREDFVRPGRSMSMIGG